MVEALVRSVGFIQKAMGSHGRFISEGGGKEGWHPQLALFSEDNFEGGEIRDRDTCVRDAAKIQEKDGG